MGQAAYIKKIRISSDESTWVEVPATSPSLDFSGDVLDDTDLEDNIGYRSRLLGLHDWSVSCDSNYKTGNGALDLIRSAKLNRTAIYVQYLPKGVVEGGFQGECVVENFNLSGDVGGLETVSITLQGNGQLSDAA